MRNLVRASVIGALALSGSFTWTVGQSGLLQTNRNLCELWASLPLPKYPNCEFQNVLVYLWMLIAALSVVWILYETIAWLRRRQKNKLPDAPPESRDYIRYIPDVRVADVPTALHLFDGRDADKLIPLLEAGKITAWARPMGSGEPPLIQVPGDIWRNHALWFVEKGGDPQMRNQTFVKTKSRQETAYYDVFLNSVELKLVWPDIDVTVVHKKKSEFNWNFEREGIPFIGISAGPEFQVRIHNFQARGQNQTGDPITRLSGYVRSDKTNKKFPIRINDGHGKMIDTSKIEVIPVGCVIDLAAAFSDDGKPVSINKFLTEIAPFTFFFECEEIKSRTSFSLEQIEPRIRAYEQQIRQSIIRPPRIKTKDEGLQ
jgi:hypothetical protein